MRICLLTLTYPPRDTWGNARHRQVLAAELVAQGQDVHVVTCGEKDCVRHDGGVVVHEVATRRIDRFSSYPEVDGMISQSQSLYERLVQVMSDASCDVVDVPLWSLQGLVTLLKCDCPTVVFLHTTQAPLVEINARHRQPSDHTILGLKRLCLHRASGILADSHSVLNAVRREYGLSATNLPVAVAHHGLPPLVDPIPNRPIRTTVEALVVGRLERWKGTPLLFEVLPKLLRQYPNLTVRFVGEDNSAHDILAVRDGTTYPEFFRQSYPEFLDRVSFEGYVDEVRLNQFYLEADFLLAPSLYESLELAYVEAMRTALPVVTFANGGANEIFEKGDAHGAYLVEPGKKADLAEAIGRLVESPDLRQRLGTAGLSRFKEAFTAEAMARSHVEFYKHVLARSSIQRHPARVIYQVMEVLEVGDAVSNIARRNSCLLAELHQPKEVLVRYAHEEVKHVTQPLRQVLVNPDCGLIFHYWAYNNSVWALSVSRGPKALYYHNITPPHYFHYDSATYHATSQGYAQLPQILKRVDFLIGDSRYNLESLSPYLDRPKPAIVIYPGVEVNQTQEASYDQALFAHLRQPGHVNIVFVGRIARNKRQDQVMRVFDYYWREVNRHASLWLVGGDANDTSYWDELEEFRQSLASGKEIMFTGKVSDSQVNTYLRAADVFLCASEHEGFCVPIVEAMALDVPVLAYAAAAVPETMGGSGLLIHQWDVPRVAELMHVVLTDNSLRKNILTGQRDNLKRFESSVARARLAAVVKYLQTGVSSPLFESDLKA